MITHHTQLLNYLIKKNGLKSYLEIGLGSGENFKTINCEYKQGVDIKYGLGTFTGTSDAYFMSLVNLEKIKENGGLTAGIDSIKTFDLIFIDGLHHADQVKRDFENSLKCLNEGGFIVIHDTLPEKEETTIVPRNTKVWHGDVYKFAMTLNTYENIVFTTINMDCGCTVVWKEEKQAVTKMPAVDWKFYLKERELYLNMIEPNEIEKFL